MRKTKIIRFILDLLIIIFLIGFCLAFLWFIHGSFEMSPTEEQQGKSLIGAIFLMLLTGIPCIICYFIRQTCKREKKYTNKE